MAKQPIRRLRRQCLFCRMLVKFFSLLRKPVTAYLVVFPILYFITHYFITEKLPSFLSSMFDGLSNYEILVVALGNILFLALLVLLSIWCTEKIDE